MRRRYIWKALIAAFPYTLPVFSAYFFLGLSYGILMAVAGFDPWVPFVLALIIYGGSLEFLMVGIMLSSFAPLSVFLVAFMVQARHLFYGIAMLEKFKGLGWKKPYLIYGLTDETFAVTYTAHIKEDVDRPWFLFWVTLLHQCYWSFSALLGGFIGASLPFNTEGISFVMTAMFIVILLEQAFKEKKHYTAIIGFVISIVSVMIFGGDSFIIPAMLGILLVLGLGRKPIEGAGGFAQ
ncbi:MAG: AzlC family ABC transporter permease [Actinomycetaceae bacterium]|nr:AzlC family ABC transporter permease [Actinomycetaceae bacterium]